MHNIFRFLEIKQEITINNNNTYKDELIYLSIITLFLIISVTTYILFISKKGR